MLLINYQQKQCHVEQLKCQLRNEKCQETTFYAFPIFKEWSILAVCFLKNIKIHFKLKTFNFMANNSSAIYILCCCCVSDNQNMNIGNKFSTQFHTAGILMFVNLLHCNKY